MLRAVMQCLSCLFLGLRRATIASICIALLPAAADAQNLPGGAQLGMTAQQLQKAVPAVGPVPHPAHMAGGLAGNWRGPAVEVAGVTLVPTFFFADAHLRRVEYVASASAGANAFNSLLAWGRAAWGAELASQEREGSYATWASGDVDAYLQQTSASQHMQVRLVIKRRVLKDASEL
jgi:hypothetical protein